MSAEAIQIARSLLAEAEAEERAERDHAGSSWDAARQRVTELATIVNALTPMNKGTNAMNNTSHTDTRPAGPRVGAPDRRPQRPTPRTILDRLIAQMGTSLDTADQLRKAADMLAAEFNNEVISDQVARLRTIATEYDDDADDIMSTIVDRYSPEQYEAAMS